MVGIIVFLPVIIAVKYDKKYRYLHWCEDGFVARQPGEFFLLSIPFIIFNLIRDSFGRNETYLIRDITKVQEKEGYVILYSGSTKIAKVAKSSENFLLLQERLLYEGICRTNS